MDEHTYLHPTSSSISALKQQGSESVYRNSGDVSGSACDLSGSHSSLGDLQLGPPCEFYAAPKVIPTPGCTSSEDLSAHDPGSANSSLFTPDEVLSIIRAEKLVGQLQNRFDCQPERLHDVRQSMRQWLDKQISTDELDASMQRHLSGDHPDDAELLESFRWFVRGSHEYYERMSMSISQSPRSDASVALDTIY